MNYLDINPERNSRTEKYLSHPGLSRRNLLALCLVFLAAGALIDFFVLGLARRTFVFYAIDSGAAAVEERMLRISRGNALASTGNLVSIGSPFSRANASSEADITRYVEEALLGPISPNSLPLFPRETRLRSLLYRNGVVYADLSEDAALPPLEAVFGPGSLQSGDVFSNMETLYDGIKRNFPFVREIRFFIAGEAAYPGKFR